ncbi:MAG TPA: trehalase-like domain-containing protein, partial [Gammaproteobacteria bacterium]|nr:trehalase-like domain-containing protein [Gammaproteobacteria bacterium]
MAYSPIGDYGIIGNGVTTALVRRDGAIDWLCLPHQDSPSVFAALLDEGRGGRFAVLPDGAVDTAQSYLSGTNVLRSRLRTGEGEAELIDFMPVGRTAEAASANRGCLLRRLHVYRGQLDFHIECRARFDYGRVQPVWRPEPSGRVRIEAGQQCLHLECSRPVAWGDEEARLTLRA